MGKIIYSKHAVLKIKERNIDEEKIKRVLESPHMRYYDISSRVFIAIGKTELGKIETNLVVVFKKEEDFVKIVTVYPCKDLDRELRKKEGLRWIKI